MQLITAEEVKNEIGKQLDELLGTTSQQTNKWLLRTQKHLLNYIAGFAWGGMAQVECYMQDDQKRAVIKDALLEHIVYLSENNFVEGKDISNIDVASKTRDIAPLAHEILENNGLLYCGKWCL